MNARNLGINVILMGALTLTTAGITSLTPTPAAHAQATNYDSFMRTGYNLAAKRDYQSALINFRRALGLRPGDRYAQTAMRNMEAYIARDRIASQPGRNRLAYIPSNLSMPGRTIAGASRAPNCVKGSIPLTALNPSNNLGLTAAAHPSLFFYIPETMAKTAELMVFNEAGELLETQNYAISNVPGIIEVTFDAGKSELTPGAKYRWNFSLTCRPEDPSANPFVAGWVERVEMDPNLVQAMVESPLQDRLSLYAANQIWNETLSTLAQLKLTQPNNADVAQQWQDYLNDAGIDQGIVNMPIVDCCKPM